MACAILCQILGKMRNAQLVQEPRALRVPKLMRGNLDAELALKPILPERQCILDFSDVTFNAGHALLVKMRSPICSVCDLCMRTMLIGVLRSNSVANVKMPAPDTTVLQLADYAQAFTALCSGLRAA